jgi:carboxymethylenebutenolidase
VRAPLSLAMGIALAALLPVPAPAQRADTASVPLGKGEHATAGFVALPAGKGAAPGVVVCAEGWGSAHSVARRLAAEGYVAIAPALDPDRAPAAAGLEAAVAWLKASPKVADRKIGIVGFGAGGTLALAYASRSTGLSAVVAFTPALPAEAARLASIGAPVLAHFGEQDDEVPTAAADKLRESLRGTNQPVEVYVYPSAGHAFTDEARPGYRVEAARQAWARTLAFLQKHLRD